MARGQNYNISILYVCPNTYCIHQQLNQYFTMYLGNLNKLSQAIEVGSIWLLDRA
jgi:hypothetical protein